MAGATGVIGVRLVRLLVASGHTVAGLTSAVAKADTLSALGAAPVVAGALEAPGLATAVAAFGPDTVIHQLTDLPDEPSLLGGHMGCQRPHPTRGHPEPDRCRPGG